MICACNGQGEFCPLHHHCADGMDCPDYHCCGVHKCRSYETVRDRLRNKMRKKERKKQEHRKVWDTSSKGIGNKDNVSIDELLAFINGESNSKQHSKSKKKKKKRKSKELISSVNKLSIQDEKNSVQDDETSTNNVAITEREETKERKNERSTHQKDDSSSIDNKKKYKQKKKKLDNLKKQLKKGIDFSAIFDESNFEDDIDQDQDEELKAFRMRLAGDAPLW